MNSSDRNGETISVDTNDYPQRLLGSNPRGVHPHKGNHK